MNPVTGSLPIEPGDLLLHTTDGLHDALSEGEITQILMSSHASIEKKAAALIDAALGSSGNDNMTVVLASI